MKTAFVDSNILIYAASGRPGDAAKSRIARDLLAVESIHLSVQVLNEFTANAIKPDKLGMSREEAVLYCEVWERENTVHSLTPRHLEEARQWFVPGVLSLWDALILASARMADCSTLFSEDFSDGQNFGGVIVRNPFR